MTRLRQGFGGPGAEVIPFARARAQRGLPAARLVAIDAPATALVPIRNGDAVAHLATGLIGFVQTLARDADGRILEMQVRFALDHQPERQGGAA